MGATEGFDSLQFRNALGKFATGVTVVTAKNIEGGYVGTTANSFNSVSLDPPLVLWSIDRKARSLESYEKGEFFAVNVLAADQVSVSNHFARQQDDKFTGVEYSLNAEGVPLLPGCAAIFECKLAHTYDGGDHTIIVGEVLRFSSSDRKELLFHNGAYAVSDYHPASEAKSEQFYTEPALPFADNYLPFLLYRSFCQMKYRLQAMLEQRQMAEKEYRLLAALHGCDGRSEEALQHLAILSAEELATELPKLEIAGLVECQAEQVNITESGIERIAPLLSLAKELEADALGHFNVEEALLFKRYLRQMLN